MSRSHLDLGKLMSTLARMAMKLSLNVHMPCLVAFRRCMSGGTSWYLAFQVWVIVHLYFVLALLSSTWRTTVCLPAWSRVMMEL